MYSNIVPIVGSVIGGGISAALGLYFSGKAEKRRRLASVRSSIFVLRDTFDPEGDVQKFHAESLPVLRQAISELISFISIKSAAKVERAWRAYQKIPPNMLHTDATHYESAFNVRFEKAMGKSCATAEEVIRAMLEHIESAINAA